MSGMMGPLETRPSMVFQNVTALVAFDASPFDSAEFAFTRDEQTVYILSRENTFPIDFIQIFPVGPNQQGQGRWIKTFKVPL